METHLSDWLNILFRFVHVVAGIMWVGSSIFFNWLDSSFTPPKEKKDGVHGELRMVHGGFFYLVEKKILAPKKIPSDLHWFMWESYMTWISGVCLLVVVYYMNGAVYLIDPGVMDLAPWQAIAIGIAALGVGWHVYDGLWKALAEKQPLAIAISVGLLALAAFGLTQVFSSRGAYIHIGAMLGTMMAANVFVHIIPNQRKMLDKLGKGEQHDLALGLRAKMRSRHNNYMTYPVVFIMLSSHFPSTYGHHLNWILLMVVMIGLSTIRHFMNIRWTFSSWMQASVFTFAVTAGVLYGLTGIRPAATESAGDSTTARAVSFTEAAGILAKHCLPCHAAHPTDTSAKVPAGTFYETPEQILSFRDKIYERSVASDAMPLGNKTGMTQEERDALGLWIRQSQGEAVPEATASAAGTPVPTNETGEEIYVRLCTQCHQRQGQGLPGVYPPLANSDYLQADVDRAIHGIIHGQQGPITVNGKDYNMPMPAQPLNDEQIAKVLTFVLGSWGNNGTVVSAERVQRVRAGEPGTTEAPEEAGTEPGETAPSATEPGEEPETAQEVNPPSQGDSDNQSEGAQEGTPPSEEGSGSQDQEPN